MNEKELYKILLEGKSNTLGRLLEIYDKVLSSQLTVMDVYNLYKMENRIVSMRVSNILKRLDTKYVQSTILFDQKFFIFWGRRAHSL